MKRIGVCLVLAGFVLVAAAPVYGADDDVVKTQFKMKGGVLYRGFSAFTMNAIETPELGDPSAPVESAIVKMNRAAAAGADTVCFDLCGFSPDGTAVAAEVAARIGEVMEQVTWRRSGGICRVIPADAPAEPAWRLAAVTAAAKALRAEKRIVYWIPGADSAALAAAFRKEAPDLVVAAEQGGDIDVVTALPEPLGDRPVLLVGTIPPEAMRERVHFLMPGTDDAYAAFDAAMANPAESAPWQPDPSVLSEQERTDGWVSLFDGKTFDGWFIRGRNKKGFAVENGTIVWKSVGGEALYSRERYANFILRLEWKIKEGGNSGIYLRAPRTGRQSKIGMEFQLQGDYGLDPESHITGAIYDVLAPKVNAGEPAEEWNELEITLDGAKMRAVLNGQVVQDVDLDEVPELKTRLREGFIGLQDHARYVAFRNIRIKRLP